MDLASAAPGTPASRDRIVVATVELVRAGQPVTIRRVAERAGVSVGLIYRYFSSDDDLVDTAWAEIFIGMGRGDTDLLTGDLVGDATDKASTLVRYYELVYGAERDETRWLRLAALVRGRREGAMDPRIAQAREEFLELLDRINVAAGAYDTFPGDAGARAAVVRVTAGIALGVTAMLPDDATAEDRRAMARATVDAIAGMLHIPLDPG